MDQNQDIPRIRKGDAFVQIEPHPLVFMEVNELDEALGNKDICIVTWYSLNEKGLNAQLYSILTIHEKSVFPRRQI